MNDAAGTTTFKGIFKRESKGLTLPPVTVSVERSRIQFFAQVLGEADPIHSDVDAARAKGYPDIVAPPSFFTVIEAQASAELSKCGHQPLAKVINCDFDYLLHADEKYTYSGYIFAGDEIVVQSSVLDFYDKKGGAMEFAILKMELTHPKRGSVLSATRTLLHRLG